MEVAIIGSRTGFDYDFVSEKLNTLLKEDFEKYGHLFIVSGGAPGVDTYVKKFVEEVNKAHEPVTILFYEEIKPINPANKLDYLFRNVEIITKADKLIIFWDGKSKGTKFVIDYAKSRAKDITVIQPKDEVKE